MTLHTLAALDRVNLADDGPLVFTASSTAVNRYGYALRNDGWRLANYEANPVVLWAHDSMLPPIGTATVEPRAGGLRATITFDRTDELATAVERKYRRGFLNAVSVGVDFIDKHGAALSPWKLTPQQIRDEAFYDLAEISAVSVPGDPQALRQQQGAALAELLTGYASRRLVDATGARAVILAIDSFSSTLTGAAR